MASNRKGQRHGVTIGFSAREDGCGVAYAAVGAGGGGSPVRVEFVCRPLPALRGRDVAYAALEAVATELLRSNVERATLAVDDDQLPLDLSERRSLPAALVVPYVALRCRLNQFRDVAVVAAHDAVARDLSARARAEVSLLVAA